MTKILASLPALAIGGAAASFILETFDRLSGLLEGIM